MTTATREVRELKQELKHLADVVQRSAKIANNNASSAASHLAGIDTDDLRRMAHKAGKDVRSFLNGKYEQAEELYHVAEKKVARNPMTAVATALAAGFVLSALFRSRD